VQIYTSFSILQTLDKTKLLKMVFTNEKIIENKFAELNISRFKSIFYLCTKSNYMAETIYFNGFNCKQSKFGIKLSGKLETIIESLKQHVNDKGYVNLEICPRREADKYGNTHYVKVDTWQKPEGYQPNQPSQVKEYKQDNQTSPNGIVSPPSDDLPF
jgi:hypothetical protein